ncbi:MAG: Flp pilus assembly protein CpaB [Desulfobulbaceae bacterium]
MAANEQNEEKSKTWKLFSAALVFAVLAGLGAVLYLKVLEHRLEKRLAPPEQNMIAVVVASRDLPAGSKVDTSTMAVRRVPAEYVNNDVITPDRFDSLQGAVLIKPLEHGKMLSQDFIDLNIPKDFSGTIQVGHRAVTIQVDEINSISGMIRPGNFIDLFTRIQSDAAGGSSSSDGEVVIPVMEDVLVLATDNSSARPNEDEFENLDPEQKKRVYNTLTLEVTPKEAALISVAESRGALIATLRNPKDTEGILFSKVGLNDLYAHTGELVEDAVNRRQNRNLDTVHQDKDGRLVTKDGVVITDPNVRLNKDGLLVTKDGTVLSGRDLVVDEDGRIKTRDGKPVDTASLVAAQNGTLVDKDGTVLDGNGYTTAKGGFLVDKDGQVLTHDGNVLTGVTVDKDGQVRAPDGTVLNADRISVDPDGRVRIAGPEADLHLDKDGNLTTADGSPARAGDLVTVDPDGTVRTRDGKKLKGVTVGKDGELYAADGRKMSADDVVLAGAGYKENSDGTVTDAAGKILTAGDLVSVGADGKVQTKDGTVLDGVYLDSDGKLKNKDGSLLTARQAVKQDALARAAATPGEILTGVTGFHNPAFAGSLATQDAKTPSALMPYEVEYIIGGGSDGTARTFKVRIDAGGMVPAQNSK